MMRSRATLFGALAFAAVAAAAPMLPAWLVSLATIAFANGLDAGPCHFARGDESVESSWRVVGDARRQYR